MKISVEAIKIGARIRPICEEQARYLADDIAENGLKEPIAVINAKDGEDYQVLSGAHRFRAVQMLEWPDVEAQILTITSEEQHTLEETKANLIRVGESLLSKALLLWKGKVAYEKVNPNSGHGGNRRGKNISSGNFCHLKYEGAKKPPFLKVISEIQGISDRTLRDWVQIARTLGEKHCQRILGAGLEIADQGKHLKLLSKQSDEVQNKIVDVLIKQPTRDFTGVYEAVLFEKNQESDTCAFEETAEEVLEQWEKSRTKEISRIVSLFGDKERFKLEHRRELIRRLLEEHKHTFMSAVRENGWQIEEPKKTKDAA